MDQESEPTAQSEQPVDSTDSSQPTTEQPAESQPLDRSWQALQRQEARLREQSESIRAARAKLEKLDQLEKLRETDPIAAARLAGLDPLAIGALALGQQKEPDPPEKQAEKRLGDHERQIQELRAELERERSAKRSAELHAQLSTLAAAAGDELGIIAMQLREPGYAEQLRARAEESGSTSWDDFLRAEEERQVAQLSAAVKNLLTSPKMRAKIIAELGPTAPTAEAQPRRPRTLTNRMQAEPAAVSDKPGVTLAERRMRALKALAQK